MASRDTVAYVAIESPEKRCGKTTLLAVLAAMANKPLIASNVTVGALFRAIDNCRPTLFIDEADTFLSGNNTMRGVINSGNTWRTAYVLRTTKQSRQQSPDREGAVHKHNPHSEIRIPEASDSGLKRYSCWCPKVIAMIGKVPDTITDRSIVVRMARKSNYDPLIRAFMVHYQFEAIHPFGDGNGRIGRVLLSLMIAKWCNLSHPWLYMSSFFEKYKDEYVTNLFKISSEGQWDKWFEFCLNGTIHQANDAISRCVKLRDLKRDMLQRTHQSGSPRTERIVSGLFSNPMVRISSLRKVLGVSYPTAQSDINRLVQAKILVPIEELRPKCYYAPEIFAIAYAEQDSGIENAEVAA